MGSQMLAAFCSYSFCQNCVTPENQGTTWVLTNILKKHRKVQPTLFESGGFYAVIGGPDGN
jgi:hypothetical protein